MVGSASARFFCCYTLLSSDGATELGLLCAAQRARARPAAGPQQRTRAAPDPARPRRCLGSSRARTFDAGQAGILKHLACSVAKDLEAFWAQVAARAPPRRSALGWAFSLLWAGPGRRRAPRGLRGGR